MQTQESEKFYKKLFHFLNLNQALTLAGYSKKYICEMNAREYEEYLIGLEYLNMRGIIDLSVILGGDDFHSKP
jgi:hypothetical protein